MKKLLFAMCIMIPFISNAQNITFDEIELGPNEILPFVGPSSSWSQSHGSPRYTPTQIRTRAGTVFVADENRYAMVGDGVFRNYNFKPNTDYYISIGIARLGNLTEWGDPTSNGSDNFRILLSNDAKSHDMNPSWPEEIPYFPPSTIRELYLHEDTYDENNPSLFLHDFTNKTLNLKFTTAANESWSSIVIYAGRRDGLKQITGIIDLTISCIRIEECTRDQYYSSPIIPSGPTYQPNAYIGSSYGTTATISSTDPTTNTQIYAYNKIDVSNTTVLSANAGKTVKLEITTPLCDQYLNLSGNDVEYSFSDYICAVDAGKPSRTDNNSSFKMGTTNIKKEAISLNKNIDYNFNNTLNTYPNPASNILNIEYYLSQSSDVSLYIYDLSGREILSKIIPKLSNGKQKNRLDISKLNPGSYLLGLTTVDGRTTKRFVVSK